MGTVLLLITLFAVLCAGVKWRGAPPEVLVSYCAFVVLVAGAQMYLKRSPRLASVMAGAVFFPIAAVSETLLQGLDNRLLRQAAENRDFFWLVVMGGLLGYLGGVLLASLFMLLENLHRWSRPRDAGKTNLT